MPTKTLSYRFGESVVRVLTPVVTRVREQGGENLPATGPCIVVANHMSHADPFVVGYVIIEHQRIPRFLAKASLLDLPLFGPILARAGQIPVFRESSDALNALRAAEAALSRGECVVIYPEGTLTRDPALWPMRAKLGAARLALATGAPVIPLAHWGAQRLLPPYGKVPHVWERPLVRVRFGAPIELDQYSPPAGTEPTLGDLMRAKAAIERGLVEQVAALRGEPAPAVLWNPKAHGQSSVGHPLRPHARPNIFTRGRSLQQRVFAAVRARFGDGR